MGLDGKQSAGPLLSIDGRRQAATVDGRIQVEAFREDSSPRPADPGIRPMRRVWRRILWWWQRDREERELEEELRAHIVIETGQRLESGANPEEAEFAA